MVPSGFEIYCQAGGCGFAGNQYTVDTSTQADPTLLYLQTVALDPTNSSDNRIGSQNVRGGATIALPLTLTNSSLGGYKAYNGGTPGNAITQVSLTGGEYYQYFYFDPNEAGSGGNGTIGYTKPSGAGTPLSGGQPYLQAVPLTVTGTPVSFVYPGNDRVGKDLQQYQSLSIPGAAPAGGLRVRVSSSSANLLLSASETAAGTQTLELTIPAGSSQSPAFYTQALASTGTAELTVAVLTSPNPGYGPGTPLTVTMVPSGFEIYCQAGGCGFAGNQYTVDTSTQADPTLLYLQTVALDPTNSSDNRIGSQNVRGGATIALPLTLTNSSLGGYKAYNGGTPGNAITQVSLTGGEYYQYFYFDPNEAGSGGNGTIGYTKPSGAGTPLSGSQPYLQSIPLTVTSTPVSFTNTGNTRVGKDLQLTQGLSIPGAAPTGGLRVRVSSSSANLLLSASETAAGTQTLELTIPAGSSQSPAFYTQALASTGTAELTVTVLTSPNPGYGGGTPLAVTMVPSGYALYCQSGGCGFANNQYTLATSTQADPALLYLQAEALDPSNLSSNSLGQQNVRGGRRSRCR